MISSVPNSVAALAGDNGPGAGDHQRQQIPGGAATGFVIDASNSILRGLAIEGFAVGVSVPNPD